MARVITESFEGAGYENPGNWTETVGAGCTVDEDSTDITTPTGVGSQTLKFVVAPTGYQAASEYDYGSELAKSYVRFYLYIDDLSALANNDNKRLFLTSSDDPFSVWWIDARKDGSGNIFLRWNISDSGLDTIDSSNINEDTWYKIEVKFDHSGSPATAEFKLDGVSQGTWTESGAAKDGVRYFNLGMNLATQAENATVYFDLFAVDDNDWVWDSEPKSIVKSNLANVIELQRNRSVNISNVVHGNYATRPLLPGQYSINAQAPTHETHSEQPELTKDSTLSIQRSLHSQTTTLTDLLTYVLLAVQDAMHDAYLGQPTLTKDSTLSIQKALHTQTATVAELFAYISLVVQNAMHDSCLELPTLTKDSTLSLQDVLHDVSSTLLQLQRLRPLNIINGVHFQQVNNLALIRDGLLTIQESIHAHLSGKTTLTRDSQLLTQNAVHPGLSICSDLVTAYSLIVANAVHEIMAGKPILSVGALVALYEYIAKNNTHNFEANTQSYDFFANIAKNNTHNFEANTQSYDFFASDQTYQYTAKSMSDN